MMNESLFTQQSEKLNQLYIEIISLERSTYLLKDTLHSMNAIIVPVKRTFWDTVSFLLKNKFGLTKDAAMKMFYDYKTKGASEDNEEPPKPPETIDEKMNLIMGYMKDTSAKLESIENDIAYLKQQVETILKKL